LQHNIGRGYDGHHIVERWSKSDGIPEEWIELSENIVRIPKLKHWEINSWLSKPNKDYKNLEGDPISPREYMKGKSWEERCGFGLKVLRDFGILKP
jgi:hypothetical protein